MLNVPTWSGLRVLNTRPASLAAPLSQALYQAGAQPIEWPLLDIEPTASAWHLTLPALSQFPLALFISVHAVRYFFNSVSAEHWPDTIHTLCIGPGTARAFHQQVNSSLQIPPVASSEALLQLACLQHVQQQPILLVKGEEGRSLITNTLQQRGAQLHIACVYRRIARAYPKKDLEALYQDNGIDMILITSQECLHHLFQLFTPARHRWLCSKPFLVLSARLAEAAKQLGVQAIITCSYDELMSALHQSTRKE